MNEILNSPMMVIDDYEGGVIKAGRTEYDFRKITPNMEKAVKKLSENRDHTENQHHTEGTEDFSVFWIEMDELLAYMADRDCLNSLTGF